MQYKPRQQKNFKRKDQQTTAPNGKIIQGYSVSVPEGTDPMKAFRKLKKMYKEERFFEELREREYYTKPSELKREAKKRAVRKAQRDKKKQELEGLIPASNKKKK